MRYVLFGIFFVCFVTMLDDLGGRSTSFPDIVEVSSQDVFTEIFLTETS